MNPDIVKEEIWGTFCTVRFLFSHSMSDTANRSQNKGVVSLTDVDHWLHFPQLCYCACILWQDKRMHSYLSVRKCM